MNKNTKMFLEVDASQIDIRQLLQKDFLELSMRAISSANPNRNNSWFTPQAMAKALPTFINKPILGYFENDDFVSHNGTWGHDSETELDYWDTLGQKGERILGIVRESDTVSIVQDKDGLSWITFTCALWTQYSFKQVKRLIKDAKRAQKRGGTTKNISVEVDILDYEMLPNGVMKINDFNLVGVTILGSRNGVPVEPGIENAELSVVDVMGREIYAHQAETLRLAYAKLDGPAAEQKEENQVEKKDQVSESEVAAFEDASDQPENEVCPECGKNPCECEKAPAPDEECKNEAAPAEECKMDDGAAPSVDECKNEAGNDAEHPEDECKLSEEGSDGDEPAEEGTDEDEDPETECKACKHEAEEASAEPAPVIEPIDIKETDEYKALATQYAEATERIAALEHELFTIRAAAFLSTANLESDVVKNFQAQCDNHEIGDLDALRTAVALYVFEHREPAAAVTETATFSSPVTAPDAGAWQKGGSKPASTVDHWSALHEYVGK